MTDLDNRSSGRLVVLTLSLLLGMFTLIPAGYAQARGEPILAGGAGFGPLLQEGRPVERRLQLAVRDAYRNLRRSLRRSQYIVSNSPTWWWRRIKRTIWPLTFALGALLVDASLLAAWKSEGLRILTTYVPLMLYVYGRLFVAAQTSIITRFGVVLALLYGVWRHDFIVDRSWISLGFGRVDDFVIVVAATRAFVHSCPPDLVRDFANRAINIRSRILRARPKSAR